MLQEITSDEEKIGVDEFSVATILIEAISVNVMNKQNITVSEALYIMAGFMSSGNDNEHGIEHFYIMTS